MNTTEETTDTKQQLLLEEQRDYTLESNETKLDHQLKLDGVTIQFIAGKDVPRERIPELLAWSLISRGRNLDLLKAALCLPAKKEKGAFEVFDVLREALEGWRAKQAEAKKAQQELEDKKQAERSRKEENASGKRKAAQVPKGTGFEEGNVQGELNGKPKTGDQGASDVDVQGAVDEFFGPKKGAEEARP